LDVKGLLKSEPVKEEPQAYIDCTGHLQVLSTSLYTIKNYQKLKFLDVTFVGINFKFFVVLYPLSN